MNEIHSLYSELYDEKSGLQTDYSTCPFLEDTLSSPKLTDSMREMCEGQLTYSKCFKVLSIPLVTINLLETMGSL